MIPLNPQYIKDTTGRTLVILSQKEFERLLEELEELEDIKLYDKAKKSNETSIPIDDAFKKIEAKRKAK
jgi:PHD/YefM family antitoxin component YafN of YafNO toxin-antitoxin module